MNIRILGFFNGLFPLVQSHRILLIRSMILKLLCLCSVTTLLSILFFFRYFNTGFETKGASSSDSGDFIFSLLKIDLRAVRIEEADRSKFESSTKNRLFTLTMTKKFEGLLIQISIWYESWWSLKSYWSSWGSV
jgi:hypothetical protein